MKNHTIKYWLDHYGNDVQAYFSLYDNVCKRCEQKYLTNGAGSEPTLFNLFDFVNRELSAGNRIEELYPNGDKKTICCPRTLTIKPTNSIWDGNQGRYVLVRNTCGVTRKSKVTVRVTKDRDTTDS